jgi:hypothetical protein
VHATAVDLEELRGGNIEEEGSSLMSTSVADREEGQRGPAASRPRGGKRPAKGRPQLHICRCQRRIEEEATRGWREGRFQKLAAVENGELVRVTNSNSIPVRVSK